MALKDKYYTISQASEWLNVTRQTFSRWIKEGKFSTEKVGRETLIEKNQVWQYKNKAWANTILGTIDNVIFEFAFKEFVRDVKDFASFGIESFGHMFGPFTITATVDSPIFEYSIKKTNGEKINITARVDEVVISRKDRNTESVSAKIKEINRVTTIVTERPPDSKKGTKGKKGAVR